MSTLWRRVVAQLIRLEKWLEDGTSLPGCPLPRTVRLEPLSTGHRGLDAALGTGGFPRGRVVEIVGAEATGKTRLALQMIAQAQRRGGSCAFIDAEHALDAGFARAQGVDLDQLLVSRPETGEEAFEIIGHFSEVLDLIVVDSAAALVPGEEFDVPMGEAPPELQAALLHFEVPRLVEALRERPCVVVFLNQKRELGSDALAHGASLRLEVTRNGLRLLKDPWLLSLPEREVSWDEARVGMDRTGVYGGDRVSGARMESR